MSIEKFGIDLRRSMKYFEVRATDKKNGALHPEPPTMWVARGMGCFFLVLVFLTILGAVH
jgi:hypothetical protein